MIPLEEALEHVRENLSTVPAEQVPLTEGLGRVLAANAVSQLTYPPADISAMDGYAVRAADTDGAPVILTQVGFSQAGSGFAGTVGRDETVRIFTGAPLPDGADAIVIQENATGDGDRITIEKPVATGTFVRPEGMDFVAGEPVLTAGTLLTARCLGLLAAMNVTWLDVRRRPRIAYLGTGDELVMPGQPLAPDQIISSNSVALDGYVRTLGGEPVSLGIARDDPQSLRSALSRLGGVDLLVTIGGASVGEFDLVRDVFGGEGMEVIFHGVAVRPGKPVLFGKLGGVPVLGMPGNPVSVGISSLLFLRPAIEQMLAIASPPEPMTRARLGVNLGENDRRQDYMRATLSKDDDGELVATPLGKQDSAMMAGFAKADALIVRPPFDPALSAGDRVNVMPIPAACATF